MTVTLDIDFSAEQGSFGSNDEHFVDLGYALSQGIPDFDNTGVNLDTEPNPGDTLSAFDEFLQT